MFIFQKCLSLQTSFEVLWWISKPGSQIQPVMIYKTTFRKQLFILTLHLLWIDEQLDSNMPVSRVIRSSSRFKKSGHFILMTRYIRMHVAMILTDIRPFCFYDLFCYTLCNFSSLSEDSSANKRTIYRLSFPFRSDYHLSCQMLGHRCPPPKGWLWQDASTSFQDIKISTWYQCLWIDVCVCGGRWGKVGRRILKLHPGQGLNG